MRLCTDLDCNILDEKIYIIDSLFILRTMLHLVDNQYFVSYNNWKVKGHDSKININLVTTGNFLKYLLCKIGDVAQNIPQIISKKTTDIFTRYVKDKL